MDLAIAAMTNERGQTNWFSHARCRNQPPALFFPSDGAGVEIARKICAPCPVRAACLDYALTCHIKHGVWGGSSERARQRILRNRGYPFNGS
jgi:WhiB family transcriptional regulator, redox-sensing transcriptional regulator